MLKFKNNVRMVNLSNILIQNILKAYNYKDITFSDIVTEIVGLYFPPLKAVSTYVCIAEKTVFSVVDEDFANCLSGLDSGLNNE